MGDGWSSIFDDAALQRVVEATGIDDLTVPELAEHRATLDAAAGWYRLDKAGHEEGRSGDREVQQRLGKIGDLAEELVALLEDGEAEAALTQTCAHADIHQLLSEHRPIGHARDVIRLVGRIAQIAKQQSEHVDKELVGHPRGTPHVRALFRDLVEVYAEVTGRNPGVSKNSPETISHDKVGGPLVRFVHACLSIVDPDDKTTAPEHISRLQRLLKERRQRG